MPPPASGLSQTSRGPCHRHHHHHQIPSPVPPSRIPPNPSRILLSPFSSSVRTRSTSWEKEASWPEQQLSPPAWPWGSRSGRFPRLIPRARPALVQWCGLPSPSPRRCTRSRSPKRSSTLPRCCLFLSLCLSLLFGTTMACVKFCHGGSCREVLPVIFWLEL
jgi:hypothetical protein